MSRFTFRGGIQISKTITSTVVSPFLRDAGSPILSICIALGYLLQMAAALRSSSTSFRCSFSSFLSTSSLSSPSSTQLAVSPNQHNSLLRASHSPATAVKASVAHLPLASRRNLSSFKVHAATDETNQPKWWEKTAGPNMVDIHSTQEFLGALSQAGDRLVIVDFYGTWCASCRALFPKLCKIAEEHPEILFLKVNFDENKPMCKSLNVKVLPYFHFYRGADRQVEAFSCSLAKFQKIKDAIATHNTAPQSSDVLVSGQVVTLEDLVRDQSRGSAAT